MRELSKTAQSIIGLGLCLGVDVPLLALHVYSVFFFELSLSSVPIAISLIAIQCWLFVGMFIVAHDAMHGVLVPGKPEWNSRIGAVLTFLYAGFGWRHLKSAHMDHHKYSGTEGDPDFNAENPIGFWSWYLLFFKRYFGVVSLVYVFSVVIIYVLVLKANYFNVVLFYGVPSILSSAQLFYFGTFLTHRHPSTDFADHHNARTLDYPEWLSLLTCYHFGYHHEHHLYPGDQWWRLPARRRALLELKRGEK